MSSTVDEIEFAPPRIIRRLDDCYFYHTIDLPGYGTISGEWDLRGRFDDYVGGIDLAGKSVLDVGTANGFLTFEAEARGAVDVVSFDIGDAKYQTCLPFQGNAYYDDHEAWRAERTAGFDRWKNGYWMAHRLLKSNARCIYGNIYDLPKGLGRFDVTIVGSVWEHLSDPVSAIGSVARVTGERMVFVTHLLHTEDRVAHFLGDASAPKHDHCWWAYSLGLYREVLAMTGFEVEAVSRSKFRCVLTDSDEERTTVIARRL